MADYQNRQVVLKSRPNDIPQSENFELRTEALRDPEEGEFSVRNLFLSVEPAMRGWVASVANYSKPVGIGEVMRSFAIGEVITSRNPKYRKGDVVCGMFGWQEYAVSNGSNVFFRHDDTEVPVSASLGVIGINGITAYLCLLDIGQPKEGETVVVSTAAGAVGSAVGQIAKIKGCTTIGITGSDEKAALCRSEFGYDRVINYRAENWRSQLAEACESGVDVYFDNTAGAISDEVHKLLNIGARVAICGTASISSWEDWPQGPRVERHLLVKRARMEGFLIFDHTDRFPEARAQLAQWLKVGQLNYREEILNGLEEAPDAVARLYRGENRGKLLIRIAQ